MRMLLLKYLFEHRFRIPLFETLYEKTQSVIKNMYKIMTWKIKYQTAVLHEFLSSMFRIYSLMYHHCINNEAN